MNKLNWEYYLKLKLTKAEGNKGIMEVGNRWNDNGGMGGMGKWIQVNEWMRIWVLVNVCPHKCKEGSYK